MGYTTDFRGEFELDKTLKEEHKAYLIKFSGTRRMIRDPNKADQLPDGVRLNVGLPIGEGGQYFVGGGGFAGQDKDGSILNYNSSYGEQPGLWCKWAPNEEGTAIEWDGGEKFYDYVEWVRYIVEHFIIPWGYTLNGTVEWQGEDSADTGKIHINNNVIGVEGEVR